MRISTYALATALAALALAVPASAQRIEQTKNTQESIRSSSGAASKNQEKSAEQQAADKLSTGRQLQLSKKARNAIVELQNAVIANDRASIPAKLAAAQALAETNDDKYAIAINQIKAATNANDLPAMRAGIDALQASGGADKGDVVARYNNLGKRYYDAKSLDQAAASFEQALAVDANNGDALKMLASMLG